MPFLLQENEVADQEAEALDIAMGDDETVATEQRFAQPVGDVGDLSRGGRAGEVSVHPNPGRNAQGRMVGNGRPVARQAWMWDGTPSTVPLAWNPEGTQHDGGRPYLTKKHCHCCGFSGFRLNAKVRGCPMCVKSNCPYCRAGQDKSKLMPCFYFRKDRVPYPKDMSGEVDCFLPACVRRGGRGFKTAADMWMHAASKHRSEYRAHMDSQRMTENRQIERLQDQVAMLTATRLQVPQVASPVYSKPTVRRQRRQPANGTPEAPLYVKE